MWLSDNTSIIDNITYFAYIKYPYIVIKNPYYTISIESSITHNKYIYGSYVELDKNQLEKYIQDYMYAKGEFELFEFSINNFIVNIKKQKI